MTRTEQNAMIARAIAEFPAEFELKAFPGKRFRISHMDSFYSELERDVMLYTHVKDGDRWLAFAKGTPRELHEQIVR